MNYHPKGRCYGETNHNSKLTNAQVLEIFYSKEKLLYLSLEYGISTTTVWRIKHGHRWQHLTQFAIAQQNDAHFKR